MARDNAGRVNVEGLGTWPVVVQGPGARESMKEFQSVNVCSVLDVPIFGLGTRSSLLKDLSLCKRCGHISVT